MKTRALSLARQVADSVALPAELLPFASELFADLPALGSSPRRVVGMLERAGLRRGASVIDLACGKGAASVLLAAKLGCHCRGVDAFAPFIAEGRETAEREGVADRVELSVGDIARTPRTWRGTFDAGLMLGLWPFDRAAPLLRSLLRPRGLYIIDDAVCLSQDAGTTRADVEAFIATLGDEVLATDVVSPARIKTMSATLSRRIAARAKVIQKREPRLAPGLRAFIADHRRSAHVLATSMRAIVWVVRRGPNPKKQ
jgi:SAM-dependent methyltransferase